MGTQLMSRVFCLTLLCLLCCSRNLRCAAQEQQQLPESEVITLRTIAKKLQIGRNLWDLSVNPCTQWTAVSNSYTFFTNNLTCGDCVNTTCHVTSIQLKATNLTGELPEEFADLAHLTQIDLTWNYINGTIPASWGRLPLVQLSLLGNRITGRIPPEIGNISTLSSLVLENNMLEGPIPVTLGKLEKLTRLFLNANNLAGELPESFSNLRSLTDFWIDGTGISGNIPPYIGNWTLLERLHMQGTALGGGFPSFSQLIKLKELMISDFNGDGSFPPVENLSSLTYLVLRNCLISGTIPEYLGTFRNLKSLDLSFNKFTGQIPSSFNSFTGQITNMYLSNNMLRGTIPDWIFGTKNLDLSYNSFTAPDRESCQQSALNLVSSFSSTSTETPCLRKDFPCSDIPKNFEFYINCGGQSVNVNGTDYDADDSNFGASTFYPSSNGKWAYSSTGNFYGNSNPNYVVTNTSALDTTNPLYLSARASASSLIYYGLCLQKGSYTVKLHFAEIIFIDNQTYFSVGRRYFDVIIQGEKVLENFNIAMMANGTGRGIVMAFNATVNTTLEIEFRWKGKGTDFIPQRGIYGPLVSAIYVKSNFVPRLNFNEKNHLSAGAIVGIIMGCCMVIFLIILVPLILVRKKEQENEELRKLKLQGAFYSLKQIKVATDNFSSENKIGQGGFGSVYKGILQDGSVVAVKQLSSKSKQGNREFVNEIGMISALQHPNLVKLYGCCIEGNQLLLIYEYLENNSLARALFGTDGKRLNLDWPRRHKISLDIARGLAYLHEESRLKIVHRDIKASNVLLDKNLNAKISDFGLAKLDEDEKTHISTRIAGTIGYMAPEYAMRGHLTEKADIYSFGVVILEIVSGKSNTNYRAKEDLTNLLDWAHVLQEQGRLLELVDPILGSNYSRIEAEQMLNLALLCTNPSPTLRPTMTSAAAMIEERTTVIPLVKPSVVIGDQRIFQAFEKLAFESQEISYDGPPTNPSSSSRNDDSVLHPETSRLIEDDSDR